MSKKSLDYIIQRNEFAIKKGLFLGTLTVLKKQYSVSFNVKPLNYSKGLKSVINLSLHKDDGDYCVKNPGVYFHEDGSGKLVIFAAVNGKINYCFETVPIPLGKWSCVKIHQCLEDGKYWFVVNLNGVSVHRVENSNVCDFKNMKVYASNDWNDSLDGYISDLVIVNGEVDYIVGNIPTLLMRGKIIADITKLEKEYLVSFDFCPYNFVNGYYNVLHFTNSFNDINYGLKVPGVWFNDEFITGRCIDNGSLTFKTHTLRLHYWSNIEICQIFKEQQYEYTVKVNGETVFNGINSKAQDFDNVKVYASDPFCESHDGSIKNLIFANGMSNGEANTLVIFPTDYIILKKEFTPSPGSLLGTLNILKKQFTLSFKIKPLGYSKGWKSVFNYILDKDRKAFGENPGVGFCEDGSGKLVVFASVDGSVKNCIETEPLPLGKWSLIKIYQCLMDGKYWFVVNLNGVNIIRVENSVVKDFKNIKVYASDLQYDAFDGSISDFLMTNGNVENLIGNISTRLVKGKIIAEIPKLDKEYIISFDVNPDKFVSVWSSVIHFTIGTCGDNYGKRIPGIWFNQDGYLQIESPINGKSTSFICKKKPNLNMWSNIEISQILKGSVYIFKIKIDEDVEHYKINTEVDDFDNVNIYASHMSFYAQKGAIKNFVFVNGISNSEMKPSVLKPTEKIFESTDEDDVDEDDDEDDNEDDVITLKSSR